MTIVIPLRNEISSVDDLLQSLRVQTRQPDRIIFVDAGSTDGTCDRLVDEVGRHPSWRVVQAGPAYPGVARNIGVALASTDLIAFTDAGITLDPEWLEYLLAPFQQQDNVDVVYGTYEPLALSYFAESAAIAYVPPRARVRGGELRGPFIASSIIRKQVWNDLGGFPEFRAAEDLIFMEAIANAGYVIAYAPKAKCLWRVADGWGPTYKRFASYSYHNLLAGRGRHWHHAIYRYYGVALFALALSIWNPAWLFLPFLGLMGRVGKAILTKRDAFDFPFQAGPRRWAYVGAVLVVIDMATLAGTMRYVLERLRTWRAKRIHV